jgi:hypothetical protein
VTTPGSANPMKGIRLHEAFHINHCKRMLSGLSWCARSRDVEGAGRAGAGAASSPA